MKILIVGFLVLFGWSALSTHIYVCNLKGFCNEKENGSVGNKVIEEINVTDSLTIPLVQENEVIPGILVSYFAFDNSAFSADSKTVMYYDVSNAYLNKHLQARLSIIGYTDAIGSDEYNYALGYRRAQSIQHYFESKGMSVGKITIESKGEKEPADDNTTVAGRANNRRTVITIKN
jgi:outer membrane protein OmpA-like peptidoglycan-associated protein